MVTGRPIYTKIWTYLTRVTMMTDTSPYIVRVHTYTLHSLQIPKWWREFTFYFIRPKRRVILTISRYLLHLCTDELGKRRNFFFTDHFSLFFSCNCKMRLFLFKILILSIFYFIVSRIIRRIYSLIAHISSRRLKRVDQIPNMTIG